MTEPVPQIPDVSLAIKAREHHLCAINAFAEAFLNGIDFLAERSDVRYALQLIISEACSNVIRHAYPDRAEGILRLDIWTDRNEIAIEVTDYGRGFDPEELPQPDLDQAHEGGYGVFLIKEVVDEFDYRQTDQGNTMRCVKRL